MLLILMLLPFTGNSQEFAISNFNQNTFYVGRESRIKVAAYKVPCNEIQVVSSIGKVIGTDNPCEYKLLINEPGLCLLSLYADSVLLGTEEYKVVYMDEPFKHISGRSGGEISIATLLLEDKIRAKHFRHIDLDDEFIIDHYSVSILRGKDVLYERKVLGADFDKELKEQFKSLKVGDTLLFYHITGKGIDNVVRSLNTMEFIISE